MFIDEIHHVNGWEKVALNAASISDAGVFVTTQNGGLHPYVGRVFNELAQGRSVVDMVKGHGDLGMIASNIYRAGEFYHIVAPTDIDHLYHNEILPAWVEDPHTRENLCEECLGYTFDVCGQDTGVCAECGKMSEVVNPFMYQKVLRAGLDPKNDWYGKAPRIFYDDLLKEVR